MKEKFLKILAISYSNPFVRNNGGKISFGIIVFDVVFLLFKKGVLTAFQFVGFVSFILCFLFVVITHKLNIYAHQQEQIRANFQLRRHQRTMLLFILTIFITTLTTLLLLSYPYAFLFF